METAKSILIVEDEPLLSNLLKQRLEKEGYIVAQAQDGQEALEKIKEQTPNLILLDIILPKVSGFEFLEKVRENPQMEEMPVIVISNLGQESDIQKGQSLGAVGYFVKAHVSIEDLVGQVKQFLESGGVRQSV